ncbi:hypothetical protein ABW20_dc0103684 [Dactylellina cionopaga]|nr:hypothetical protein ABW20_dc0103684 [Dactylellina cionopaga]
MSLFGQSAMQPSQGGNFGGVKGPSPFLPPINSNTNSGGTGLFGQPDQQAQAGNTVGLFGQSTANTGTTGGGGLFGQNNANTGTAGGMFGQQAASTSTMGGGGGLFGQPQQQQQQQQLPSMFGQSQQQQPQQQQNAGGSINSNSNSSNSSNLLVSSVKASSNPSSSNRWEQEAYLEVDFNRIKFPDLLCNILTVYSPYIASASLVAGQVQRVWDAWNVSSPGCQFQTYLYNQADNEVVANSYEPGQGEDKLKFDAAMRKRPNPKAVPVLVRGFNDLQLRMQQQENQIVIYRATLHGINNRLIELSRNHDLKTTIKLAEAVSRHQQLAHRTLSLSAKVQVLKNRGYALQPEEDQLRKRLETLMKTVSDPGVNGRMNEIWARMQIINQKARQMENEINEMSVTVDPEHIQKMATVLQTHEKGIKGLREELQRLEETFEKWEQEKQAMKDRQFGR